MREVRQNLSVYLRRVRAGEAFTVTDHGLPVALLTPVPSAHDDPLADLISIGKVAPAGNRGGQLPERAQAPAGRPTATEALLADRRSDER